MREDREELLNINSHHIAIGNVNITFVTLLYLVPLVATYSYPELLSGTHMQCYIQEMWLGGQTESFQNVGGGAKVYTM